MKQLETTKNGDIIALVGPVRFSYLNVYKPRHNDTRNEEEYSAVLLIPKASNQFQTDAEGEIKGLVGAIKAVLGAKFPQTPPVWSNCMKDGDKELNKDTGEPKHPGYWFISTRTSTEYPPKLIDGKKKEVSSSDGWVSGDWGIAKLSFFAYDAKGNKGVSASLRAIQFLYKDEPFGSTGDPLDGFEEVENAHASTPAQSGEYDPFAD